MSDDLQDLSPDVESSGTDVPSGTDVQPPSSAARAPQRPAEEETVDGLPVLAEVRPVERLLPASLPAVQAAAVAATGFVAGAATVALVKRRGARKLARVGRGAQRRGTDLLPIVGTRTFLVDVHLVAKPDQ